MNEWKNELRFDIALLAGLGPPLFASFGLIAIGKATWISNIMGLVASLTFFFVVADIGNIVSKNILKGG